MNIYNLCLSTINNLKTYNYNSKKYSSVKAYETSIIVSMLISLFVTAFLVFCLWKLFKKAGYDGWKALIPGYSFYILFKIATGKGCCGIICSCLYFISSILRILTYINNINIIRYGLSHKNYSHYYEQTLNKIVIIGIIYFIVSLAKLGLYIYLFIKLSNSFGQGGGFAVGLIFLGIVFFPMLALGKYQYYGPYYKKNQINQMLAMPYGINMNTNNNMNGNMFNNNVNGNMNGNMFNNNMNANMNGNMFNNNMNNNMNGNMFNNNMNSNMNGNMNGNMFN